VHKTDTFVRICNHLKSFTLQKILYDETNVTRFLCFGGGVTNLEVEFLRDTYCVSKEKLNENHSRALSNSYQHQNDSIRSHYAGDEESPLDPNVNPDNVLEIRYHIDNTKSSSKVDEVLVQLLQIVGIKGLDEDEDD